MNQTGVRIPAVVAELLATKEELTERLSEIITKRENLAEFQGEKNQKLVKVKKILEE